MDNSFYIWQTNREWMIKIIESYSLEQLNKIPEGCNNNLIWHFGHSIVTQQRILYMATKMPHNVPKEIMDKYKPRTKPEGDVTTDEVNQIKELATSLISQTKQDFENDMFVNTPEFTTSTGFHINCLDRAFEFNNYHEGLHLGMMSILKKFL